jgi:hypothetical protein
VNKIVWLALGIACGLCACANEPAAPGGADAAGDAGEDLPAQDADVHGPDVTGDLETEPDTPVDPGLTEGTVTAGGTTVHLAFDPFRLTVRRGDDEVVSSYDSDAPGFGGLEVGIAPDY